MRALSLLALSLAAVYAAPNNVPVATQYNNIAERIVKVFKDPVANKCEVSTLGEGGIRYQCDSLKDVKDISIKQFSSDQVEAIFGRVAKAFPGAKDKYELSTLSLFRARYRSHVIGLHKGADNFGIVYGKGCDWRSYAVSDKKDKEGKIGDFLSEKLKYKDYVKYFDAARKDNCVTVTFEGLQPTGEVPKDAQVAMKV
jgi:hypothetical protein